VKIRTFSEHHHTPGEAFLSRFLKDGLIINYNEPGSEIKVSEDDLVSPLALASLLCASTVDKQISSYRMKINETSSGHPRGNGDTYLEVIVNANQMGPHGANIEVAQRISRGGYYELEGKRLELTFDDPTIEAISLHYARDIAARALIFYEQWKTKPILSADVLYSGRATTNHAILGL
jgi:hypothetical protein